MACHGEAVIFEEMPNRIVKHIIQDAKKFRHSSSRHSSLCRPIEYGEASLVCTGIIPCRINTIIITGCSSGIGAYCARALKKDGWRVFAIIRKVDDLAPLQADGIEAFRMDYTSTDSIADFVREVTELSGGRIDALFSSGAMASRAPSRT